jgi:aspartate/glutamate racemase
VLLSLPLLTTEKTISGGLYENRLKKEKGLRFTFPEALMVDTSAMGRGAMAY